MFKNIKKLNPNIKLVDHWEKKLENGVKVYGCTLKRNKTKNKS